MTSAPAIHVERLVVEHASGSGAFRALDCHELVVDGGSTVAVVGPSGCGKSTLLGVLAGLASPTSGIVKVGEVELTDLNESARVGFRRRAVGVVYQADNLLPFLTVFENVRLQLALCDDNEDADGRTTRLLDRLGLGELLDRLPDQLSGGQRQRVAVARAIVHRPDLLLADEPTGSLDEENARAVVELLLESQERLGSTLVMVTHDPMVASSMSRLVTLRDGMVVGDSGGRRQDSRRA